MEHFDVYVAGFDVGEDRAVPGLMQVFGMNEATAQLFFRSLPLTAKRNQTADAADRYVRALRSIGAVVRCHESRAPSPSNPASHEPSAASPKSLAPPLSTAAARLAGPDAPLAPSIPKAGRLPQDLVALAPPHAAPDLPQWFEADAAETTRALTASLPAPISFGPPGMGVRHDALTLENTGLPPIPELDPVAARGRGQWAPRPDHVGTLHSHPPSRAPGVPARSPSRPPPPVGLQRHQVLIACALAVAGLLYFAYGRGVFETEAGRTLRSFAREGIDPGVYRAARTFLDTPGVRFEGVDDTRLRTLLDGVIRAGAPHVWVAGIEAVDGIQVAHCLLIELPDDAGARRTVLFQHVQPVLPDQVPADTGQRYLRLTF
jgi:hypothetical protein